MGGQLLLALVLILVSLFVLPSASPMTGALGGQTGEESALLLQFTVDSGEDLGGGLDSTENVIGHSSDGSGLFVGSDVVRGSFHSLLYDRWRGSLTKFSPQQRPLPAGMLLCKMEKR